MEIFFGLAVLAALSLWAYKSGKRIGSRKGYNAGRRAAARQHILEFSRENSPYSHAGI